MTASAKAEMDSLQVKGNVRLQHTARKDRCSCARALAQPCTLSKSPFCCTDSRCVPLSPSAAGLHLWQAHGEQAGRWDEALQLRRRLHRTLAFCSLSKTLRLQLVLP